MDNTVLIAINEIESDISGLTGEAVEERLRAAMKSAQNHWLVTNEDAQFQAAVSAVLLNADDEEKERIEGALSVLRGLSAAFSGVPVDIVPLLENAPKNPIGLKKLWDEAKELANG